MWASTPPRGRPSLPDPRRLVLCAFVARSAAPVGREGVLDQDLGPAAAVREGGDVVGGAGVEAARVAEDGRSVLGDRGADEAGLPLVALVERLLGARLRVDGHRVAGVLALEL